MSDSASRILVVRAGALGDTLMATPVLPALRERHPGAAIDFLASATAAPLLAFNPHLRHVHRIVGRNLPYALSLEKRALVGTLRGAHYDLAIVLEHAPRYYRLVARARIPRVRGFRDTPFDPALHSVVNNLRAAGFEDAAPPADMRIVLVPEDERAASALLDGVAAPAVGFHAGYGPTGRKPRQDLRLRGWSADRFVELGRALAARGFHLVLTGAPEDRPLAARIASALPPNAVRVLAGRTDVRELAAVIRQLDLFVSVDSGPAHMAAAVGTPLVVLWGPGILAQTRPVSSTAPIRIVHTPVPCAPCYGTPLMKRCRQNICMESIAPAQAMAAIEEVWNGSGL
ncbi:MAG: glycosyltransferase family 9 protein [Acidobacteria bacterium]|nr:glycosyltransferase family 9 protein [Acidobacteriota bacterium]